MGDGDPRLAWIIAAKSTVALHQDLIARVIPEDQDFDDDYAGIFRFG